MTTALKTRGPRSGPFRIGVAAVRAKLPVRKEPYWGEALRKGQHVGLRKISAQEASWIARYRAEGGRQEYKSLDWLRPDFDYEQAKVKAEEWFKEKSAGVAPSTVITVADACRAYVKALRTDKDEPRPLAARDAEARFTRTIWGGKLFEGRTYPENPLGAVALARLTTTHLDTWRADLTIGKASKNRTLTAVKAAIYRTIKTEKRYGHLIAELRAIGPIKKAGKRRGLYLDPKQRRALLKAAKGAVHDLIESVMLTGCRAGELTGLTLGAFDAKTGSATFTGKTGSRTVPLAPAAVTLFKRLSKGKKHDALLLTRGDGQPWKHSDWDGLVRDAAAKAKLPEGVCLYTLRHSFITSALTNGGNTFEVAKIVGTSIKMIDDHYGHVTAAGARKWLDRVAKL